MKAARRLFTAWGGPAFAGALAMLPAIPATPAFANASEETQSNALTALERRDAYRQFLFERLAAAETRADAQEIEGDIWAYWYEGPEDAATQTLALARETIGRRQFVDALRILDALIDRYPDWAEPYNQRAILYFVLRAYDASLSDIDRTLAREPLHFGALSGGAQIHLAEGRFELAAQNLLRARSIHPWIGGATPEGQAGDPL